MAYDQELASRIEGLFAMEPGLTQRRMFGGLGFMLNGNMAAAASSQGGILLRCDPGQTAALVTEPGVERFEMRGRSMDGWLHIEPGVVESDDDLARWLAVGADYARSLPPK